MRSSIVDLAVSLRCVLAELDEAIRMARAERTNPTEAYLLGIPLLADYLEEGLDKLGYSIEDVERDVL